MKKYIVVINVLFVISIIFLFIFIIWHTKYTNFIGYIFLLIASVNLLIMQIIEKRRKEE